MKIIQSTIIRALCSIITGALLIKYREQTVTWLTIAIGVMFLISGIVSCAAYIMARRHNETIVFDANGRQITGIIPPFPIVGVGSIILGLILTVMPGTFIAWLMYLLAGLLIVGAISQFANMVSVSKIARVGLFFWIMPSLILLTGLIAIIRPSAIASAPLFVIGWCMMLYGATECVNAVKIYRMRKSSAWNINTPAGDPKETTHDSAAVEDKQE